MSFLDVGIGKKSGQKWDESIPGNDLTHLAITSVLILSFDKVINTRAHGLMKPIENSETVGYYMLLNFLFFLGNCSPKHKATFRRYYTFLYHVDFRVQQILLDLIMYKKGNKCQK